MRKVIFQADYSVNDGQKELELEGGRLSRRAYNSQAGVKGFEQPSAVTKKRKEKDLILRDIQEKELTSDRLDKENNRGEPMMAFSFQA